MVRLSTPALLIGALLLLTATSDATFKLVLFYEKNDGLHQDIVFNYAVSMFNNLHVYEFQAHLEDVTGIGSFQLSQKACALAAQGAVAFFGPQQPALAATVASVAKSLEIPHLVTTRQAPLPPGMHTALADVVRALEWRSYTVLYEDDEALSRLQGVLQARDPSQLPIMLRKMDPEGDDRPTLKKMKHNAEMRVVLDCSPQRTVELLRQTRELGMMDVYHSFFLTNLDAHTMDLTEFRQTGANITAVRLLDPNENTIRDAITMWDQSELMMRGRRFPLTARSVRTETALMYDAALFYHHSLVKLNASNSEQLLSAEPAECRLPLRRYSPGLHGRRKDFSLQVVELSKEGFNETGKWELGGYYTTRSSQDLDSQITESLQSKLIIVSSRIPRDPTARGNDQFEGYSLDLIAAIARILNMTFEFRLVPDSEYGSFNPKTQKWTGLLGELLERRADLAICDLTITYVREEAVDFTMPFMNLGISILYKKAEKAETNLFSFLEPFSIDVWIYMATAYLGVSLLLFVLARSNPHEWDSGHPCDKDPEELENNFNMVNCLWFSLGSLMGQGCDILPRAVSTRMVAGMWWFFTLIMISSYTANLAAFLTVTRMDDSIKNVEDLAKQTKIKYGTYASGSTAAFFRESNNSLYQRMWTVMNQARPSVFTSDNKEGVERVKKGKGDYAFFMESTSIEYETRKNCDLVKVGGQLDSKGYGIALPPGSPYRKMINWAILKLQQAGELKVLKNRWWVENVPDGCAGQEEDDSAASDSPDLDLTNVGGVFLVLVFGCIAAFLVAILEFLWNCRKIAVEEKISFTEMCFLKH
ncbi:Glutamate receptor 1 [Gryllus bimaculatus]|nr:Glutamate receptor 1 [Gryllus bimaculatus]